MPRPRNESTAERRHIAVTGFMGAGKSTVGKLLAERLGWDFVDLDETIAKKAGRSIPEIFREHGEVGFRAHERAALREVLEAATPLVIATGGGTFADPSMRGWVQAAARTVYLRASAETIFERVGAGAGRSARPLLSSPDPLATIRRLLAERSPAYELCEVTVTTDQTSTPSVVEEIVHALKERARPAARRETRGGGGGGGGSAGAAGPRAARPAWSDAEGDLALGAGGAADAIVGADGTALVRVHAAWHSYAVELRPEAGAWVADAIAATLAGERLAVISDATVAALHAPPLVAALEDLGRRVTLHTFPPGEDAKTLATVAALHDQLITAGLSRADCVIALGGGVAGDVAGFVASTFLRGVPFVQVPTTTLAAVDASVGGKTGVNTPRGKNLVGTFHAPRAVLIAGAHLATQPPRGHAAGLVEALKIAAALDARAFDALVADTTALLRFEPAALARAIGAAVSLKAGVVGRDEHEADERAVLNFGHTVGHAIETGEGYRLMHGEAVALGMLAEASWAEAEGLATGVVAPLAAALAALGVPTRWRDARVDFAALGADKKRQGAGVRLPIVKRIGAHELTTVTLASLVSYLGKRSG